MLKKYLITFWNVDGTDAYSVVLESEPCKLSETVNKWAEKNRKKIKNAIAYEQREITE